VHNATICIVFLAKLGDLKSVKFIFACCAGHECTFPGCANVIVIDGNLKTDEISVLVALLDG